MYWGWMAYEIEKILHLKNSCIHENNHRNKKELVYVFSIFFFPTIISLMWEMLKKKESRMNIWDENWLWDQKRLCLKTSCIYENKERNNKHWEGKGGRVKEDSYEIVLWIPLSGAGCFCILCMSSSNIMCH